jgi:hypothetical protein
MSAIIAPPATTNGTQTARNSWLPPLGKPHDRVEYDRER